ncbi:MAG: hypothetical protein U0353_22355 [Sandaracinus sp.]
MKTPLTEVAARVPGGLLALTRAGLHRAPLDASTIEVVCGRLGLPVEATMACLTKVADDARARGETPIGELDASDLALRIAREHHTACFETSHLALGLARRLAKSGEPVLGTIAELVETLVLELHAHIEREDRSVLARARALVRHTHVKHARAGDLDRAMHAMHLDHEATALLVAEIRARASNYHAPEHASALWRGLYELLEELDAQLRFAVWIEEALFFPLVRQLEEDSLRQPG